MGTKTKNNNHLSKRSKPPTSFRRHKILQVKSGRKFKQKRRLQKKARKAVSDSSFSISYLTESLVSTPVSSGPRKNRRTPKTVKGGSTSTSDSVIVSGNVEAADKTVTPSLCEDLKYKFRNDHITYYDKDLIKPKVSSKPASESVTVGTDNDSKNLETIVIEDDDDPTLTPTDVGNIMLNMLNPGASSSDQKEEDSVRLNPYFQASRSNKEDKKSDNLKEDEKGNETIVLDDTADEDIIIVNDKDFPSLPSSSKQTIIPPSPQTLLKLPPLTSSNIQQITSRYPSSAPEFIPLFSKNSSFSRHKSDFRRGNRGRFVTKRLQPIPASNKLRSSLRGTVSRAPRESSNPSSRPESNVWHSSRRQEEKTNVVVASGPTVFTGDKDKDKNVRGSLRPIVIDGSNVAMSHGANNVFSVRGIELTVDYFKSRGHKEIVAFLPQWRNKLHQSSDKKLLDSLEAKGYVTFTPSREVDNKRINSYDDTFILDYAAQKGAIVVTRDNYRDLVNQKKEWREVIENRILMQTFVGDMLMWPHDPLGRTGPTLDEFLRF